MKFRVARHTNSINELKKIYVHVIGLEILGDFKNHSGYDGVFIGKAGADWHLEFTQTNEQVKHLFDEDDLLVFYPATQTDFDNLISAINSHKIAKLEPKNPYWHKNGITIEDPDGYRIVISLLKIA